jgi:hypothetical protein
MRHKVTRKAVHFLASVALASVVLGGVAAAHPLEPKPFESDITQDKIINFCNPDAITPVLFGEAISDWNSYALDNSAPVIVDVTASEGAFCELRPDRKGGDSADYLAQVDFNAHPDSLDISNRFADLERDQRGATLRHELGHAAMGLNHNEKCAKSVMPTLELCDKKGTPRSLTVGPHDGSLPDTQQVLDQQGRGRGRRVRPVRPPERRSPAHDARRPTSRRYTRGIAAEPG